MVRNSKLNSHDSYFALLFIVGFLSFLFLHGMGLGSCSMGNRHLQGINCALFRTGRQGFV